MRPAAPPPLDPDEARSRILEELSKPEYDDSPASSTGCSVRSRPG
ncbi:hypothetical protein [Brachybacterium sp. Z12]|nr:hypothetical protein [Brachybacterium sp. Z12]